MKLCIDLQELAEISNNRMKTLFISCVGSHMWGMQSKESDIDLVMIYIAPTRAILRAERISPTIRQQIAARGGEIYDTLGWEVGHLINQLIKGNVNAIWYVTSPLLIKPSVIQEELSALVQENLCRQTYHSIKGMAESQIKSETKPGLRAKATGRLCEPSISESRFSPRAGFAMRRSCMTREPGRSWKRWANWKRHMRPAACRNCRTGRLFGSFCCGCDWRRWKEEDE